MGVFKRMYNGGIFFLKDYPTLIFLSSGLILVLPSCSSTGFVNKVNDVRVQQSLFQ